MLSLRHSLDAETQSLLRKACDEKRSYLMQHIDRLVMNTDPTTIWSGIVKYRYRTFNTNDETVESYNELQLSYEGYRNMVYEVIFHVTPEEDSEASQKVKDERRCLFFAHPFLSPAVFLAFKRSDKETVPAVPLYAFAAKRLLLFRLRVELELVASVPPPFLRLRSAIPARQLSCSASRSSPLSNGLTEEDLENFIGKLIPHLKLVRDMPPWMRSYYLCHASRKFMFMCDPHNVGSISIDTVMKSDVFSEMLRLFESNPKDAVLPYPVGCAVEVSANLVKADLALAVNTDDTVPAIVVLFENEGSDIRDKYTVRILDSDIVLDVPRGEIFFSYASADYYSHEVLSMDNWFSFPLMCRIYEHFTALDKDEDGVLTMEEISHYSNDSFTHLAIKRVFECHVPHTGERHVMDYKTYLNFVIATEHAATRAAMKYIWKILDLDGTSSYIRVTTLHCFCKEIANELVQSGLMVDISGHLILSEIVDMINPKWHEWVTLEDIEKSAQQATVLPILLSYRNFFAYDSREHIAATTADEYLEFPDTDG
ncbi:unnamed protein product [Phytomonas sp. EM1]|nr:unnamed protein product [Phytomonas sp. EM1]|eukprot:CCW63707.1 unnamed protein product [Phytomonas sp. isolate EM1]